MGIGLGSLILVGLLQSTAEGPSPDRAARIERNGKMNEVVLDHYPRASLKAGEEGKVGFQVQLDKRGKLESCVVTQSSGYPRLDNATCEMIVATARFKPVENEDGWGKPSTHEGSMVWNLPTGFVKGPPPAPTTRQVELADTQLICKRTLKNGSLYVKTKVCLSKDDWARTLDNSQRETRRLQEPKGPLLGPF